MMTKTMILVTAVLAGGSAASLTAQYPQPYPYSQPYQQPYPAPGYGYGQQPGYAYGQQPGYAYGQQPGYAYGQENVLGQIIDALIGTRYNVSDRQAIRQCTYAAVNEAETRYRPYFGPNWRRPYAGYNGNIRVSSITDVQRRSNGVRVRGLLDTGLYRRQSQGAYQGGYVGGYGGDLNFRCDVDYRGYVSNVRIDRNGDYRG